MNTHRLTRSVFARTTILLLVFGSACVLNAQEKQKKEEPKKAETAKPAEADVIVTNLDNPTGLAVHPQTGQVFIASHLAVYRFVPSTAADAKVSGTVTIEVAGFPTDVYGKGPKYNIGPLGLAFLDNEHLVVGDGSREDGKELVRVYKIGAEAPKEWIKEGDAEFTLGPIGPSDQTEKGEGNFYGVAVGGGDIFVTCNGDDTKGWVAKAEVKDGKPGELKLDIATKTATNVDAPGPATFSPDGDLVVGQIGEVNVPKDSLVTFYDPKTGKLKKSLKAGINDICGMAYHPKTGKLYATDFSWIDAAQGALYRLDINGDQITPTKIVDLDKPTALAFDKDGRLYVTVFGTQTEEQKKEDKSPGQLLRIESGL